MNYIDILKKSNKVLVINGPEGSGKSLLARQLAEQDVNVEITAAGLTENFNYYLKDKPSVVVVDAGKSEGCELITKLKQLKSHKMIGVEIKGKNMELIPTPFFILNVNSEYWDFTLSDARHFTVINVGDRK